MDILLAFNELDYNLASSLMSNIIPFALPLTPILPRVVGNLDYTQERRPLERINQLLATSDLEAQFIQASLGHRQPPTTAPADRMTPKQQVRFQEHSRRALRCNIARALLQVDYRGLAVRLADSPLYQWFCAVGELEVIQVPSKSTLQRYDAWVPTETLRPIMDQLLRAGRDEAPKLQLLQPLDLDRLFLDSTCLKAKIHFPVDWVLLRDGTRTVMKAVSLIRQQGLKQRMESPEKFIRRMNGLCIAMTQARRQPASKKQRKRVLRSMKRVVHAVAGHARRYRDLLDREWARTQWSRKQTEQVLKRLDGMLEQLPAAITQAHERIIGERPVKNADKMLSLYEPDLHVIVRGKAEAEVEFGNLLLLSESPAGLIADFQLFQDRVPADVSLLPESVERAEQALGQKLKGVGADRGFDSQANRACLEGKQIYNGICPKAPETLKQRLKQKKFVTAQRRRAQTEGRIGILKNNFLGRPLRAKGFVNRERAVAWAVLAHNLWVMARLPQRQVKEKQRKAA